MKISLLSELKTWFCTTLSKNDFFDIYWQLNALRKYEDLDLRLFKMSQKGKLKDD